MNISNIFQSANFLKIGILLSIVVVSFMIANSSLVASHPQVINGVTLDLTLTLPLAYLFFIRKTKISKLTVVPFFVFGTIAASLILPAENHRLLDLIKFFTLPVVELGILAYVALVVYKSRKTYKTLDANQTDFLENLRETLVKGFPIRAAANALTYEIAGFYYAFVGWKTNTDENSFTYYKKSGVFALLSILIFIIAIETVVLHILIAGRNSTIAWILTAASAYFLFQIFAHGKAVFLRPIQIANDKIRIRCGLLGDAIIEPENIESVELTTQIFEKTADSVKLSPLGKLTAHNLKIRLRNQCVLNGVYGMEKKFRTIFLTIDEAEKFKQTVEEKLKM